ncbi:brassinosteroid-responsive RING protein 1-like [Primulina tabacum]|uniref:brassinosteroid-responsive RING protein 1-like n=1 Tax=Primulina tabacum TaxID=48773 RepID=UPI003F5A3A57
MHFVLTNTYIKMLRIQHKSVAFDSIVMIARLLKLTWDYLLYRSFVFANGSFEDDLLGRLQHQNTTGSGEHGDECAVCLCRIDEEDEVADIMCNHLFHRACLDRWMGFGHITCPLCRNNIRPPLLEAEPRQEMIQIRFWAAKGTRHGEHRDRWWLR